MNLVATIKSDFGIRGNIFTKAQEKAFLNAFIIPLFLTIVDFNILLGLTYIFFMSVVYLFIQKRKIENAKAFFLFLKYEAMFVLLFTAVILILIF